MPGNHQRGCAEEESLGRFVPMPASRPGASQGVWGEVGEDSGEEIKRKVAPHCTGAGVNACTASEDIYDVTTKLVAPLRVQLLVLNYRGSSCIEMCDPT